MEITPQDVQNKQFDQVKRGFDPQQVGIFLDQMAAALAARDRELHEAHTEIAALGRAVVNVKQNEEAFRLTMTAATQAKEEILARAAEMAAKIEDDARAAAAATVERARVEAEDQTASVRRELESPRAERSRLEEQLTGLRPEPADTTSPVEEDDAPGIQADRPPLELVVDRDEPAVEVAPDNSELAARVGDLRG